MVADPQNPHQQQVLAHWDLLNQLAKKRFPERGGVAASNLAEEAALHVLDKLAEDDWSRVRQYRAQSSFRGFLAQTAQRLLEDFARHKFGRARVPGWIKTLGPLWERVYQKLCRERWPAPMVIEHLRATLARDSDPAVLGEMIAAIRARVIDCGVPSASRIEQSEADLPENFDLIAMADPTPNPEDLAAAEQHVRLLKMIAELLDPERAARPNDETDDSPLTVALRKLRDSAALALVPEERLLLRLVFQEGLTVAEAGRRLGLNVNQSHGRLRRLLERIDSALQATGFDRIIVE